jgi:thioesterase domain-containing protein
MALALDAVLRDPAPSPSSRVFLLPGARGDTPGLAGLRADCLPVASVQMVTYPGWREMLRMNATLDGIAEVATAQVHAMSLPGPVCLIGYSFGAYVAYAVSCLLESEGREVAQLVLVDMPPPSRIGQALVLSPAETAREMWWSANRLKRAVREGTASEHVGMLVASLAATVVRVRAVRALAASRATKGWSQHLGDLGYWIRHHLGQEVRLQAANEWARRWRAPTKRLRAPLLLIRSEEIRPGASEDLGWSEIAEQVRVVHVEGTHVTMLSVAHRNAVSTAVSAALAGALSPSHAAASAD